MIGDVIRHWRQTLNLSLFQLGEKTGIHPGHLRNIEVGKRQLTEENRLKINAVLHAIIKERRGQYKPPTPDPALRTRIRAARHYLIEDVRKRRELKALLQRWANE